MIRRSHTLVKPYEVVSRQDDALDKDAPDFDLRWDQYLDGAGDPPLKPGAKPATFKLRHLKATERDRLAGLDGDAARLCYAACALALMSVDGLVDEDGKPIKIRHDIDKDLHALQVVSRESMDLLGQALCVELGATALRRSSPRPN